MSAGSRVSNMRAVILAAGRGSRLADFSPQGQPKCLMEFGGRSLLARHLENLHRFGMRRADLVVGYEADRVIDHVGTLAVRPDVSFHFNPRYEQGSVISLWAARETLEAGVPVLVMDADVLYHPLILERLVNTGIGNCYLLDREFTPGEEPVKIAVRDGLMVDFRKRLDPGLVYDTIGESVGFFRFEPACAAEIALECARFDREGLADSPHEEALRNLLLEQPRRFGYEDISGLPWIEIDFPEDVERAVKEILPAIRAEYADY
ncbi:MAG: phosphocholine cytidylyltransferase family protein [Xanthomonadales bacterium]|nr:phosphocholine cytidylyltransferase family protein [Xanthomonadales bacterium]